MCEGDFCARQMVLGAAAGNCPLKDEIHVLGDSGHLGREGEKDLTGEGFSLAVTLRKGLFPRRTRLCMEIPQQRILSRLVLPSFTLPCTSSSSSSWHHPRGVQHGYQGNVRWNAEFRTRRSLSWCLPHSCHSHCPAQAPAGPCYCRTALPVHTGLAPSLDLKDPTSTFPSSSPCTFHPVSQNATAAFPSFACRKLEGSIRAPLGNLW